MWGDPSDSTGFRTGPRSDGAPTRRRDAPVRVITLYGTPWWAEGPEADHRPLPDRLPLGRLAPFYRRFAAQLPSMLVDEPLDTARADFRRWTGAPPVGGRLWLLGMPSRQLVVGLVLDVVAPLSQVGDLVEDCAHGHLTIDGLPVPTLAARIAAGPGTGVSQMRGAWPAGERHQIVVLPTVPDDPVAAIRGLLARTGVGYRGEPGPASFPEQLNRADTSAGGLTEYATVLCRQPEHVVHGVVAVAAQALANVGRLHEIDTALYRELRLFWAVDRATHGTRARRAALEAISHKLARLELDLTVAVEAPAAIGALVPSQRVREYQHELHSLLDLPVLAGYVSRMLRRLESTGRAELASVSAIERRRDEDRHQRWAVAVGFVSAVAIPLSLILAFFSARVAEIDDTRSIFHREYLWIYGAVGVLVLSAVAIGFATFVAQRRRGD